MRRPMLVRIIEAVKAHDPYFVQNRNVAHILGLSPEQKVTAAMRMLCYGVAADAVDEYIRIGASTATMSLKRFVRAVSEVFGGQYLRSPTESDTARLLAHSEARGFPGMLGSIDCMHWRWKNCPSAWQGQYSGHYHEPTIILEAVASHDLWIWHAFFGLPGSLNDINVLHRSPLFQRLAVGEAPPVNYIINGHNYSMGYYLADGIYPRWATFVKTITAPQDNKKKHFAKMQEAARKDVERAFGVLQARFAIVRGPARFWDQEDLGFIMRGCIVLHNMIVEDEGAGASEDLQFDGMGETVNVYHGVGETPLWKFIETHQSITDAVAHSQLQADLVEHLWQQHGDRSNS